jgi:DNA-binding response OmpR family regulator/two-component sensor histidine kinase
MKTAEWSDLLHTVRRSGYRLLNLVNQLLYLARLEAGKMQLAPVNGDLVAFLRDLVDSCHSYAQTRRILMRFESEAPELQMAFDPDKIQTIFANLLSNALKFTPEGGRIDLRITMEHLPTGEEEQETVNRRSFIVIQVTDTGSGIPEDRLGRIFDRFYQMDHSTTRKGEGAGIGLALVQELVKLLEGTIAVENAVGAGASFRVRLPYLPPQPALRTLETDQMQPEKFIAPLPLPQPEVAGSDDVQPSVTQEQAALPLLLIVEDDADVRRYLAECVKHEYRVVMADNGGKGIQKATELIPDIIISDVLMPEKDGLELCETLKNDERTSHIPIVLLTARIDVESRIAGLKRGADVYLAKPFAPAELHAHLDNLVRLRRRLQQRYVAVLQLPLPNDDPGLVLENAFLLKIREVVEAHLAVSDFEMSHLELALSMSYSQIFRKVKALTGGSPSMLIRSIRLYKAKELLLDDSLTIAEVAYAVGFSTPAYFSTTFLETFGKTPGEFRRG